MAYSHKITFDEGWSMCVVLASKDYPYSSGHGEVISGLDDVDGVRIYHAGTARDQQGQFMVNGGRVLAVAGRGDSREEVLKKVYAEVPKVTFDGAQFRPDIGTLHFEETD